MHGIMADVRTKEGSRTAPSHAHVNGSLMKQYDRCIIEILFISFSLCLSLYVCLFSARDPSVSVFSRYSAPRYFSTSHRVSSMCLCPLMANLSSLAAYNFRSVIIKDVIQTRCMIKENVVLLMCNRMNY